MKIGFLDELNGAVTEYTYKQLEEITGIRRSNLSTMKTRKLRLQSLGGYIVNLDIGIKEKNYLLKKFVDEHETWREITVDEDLKGKSYFASSLGRIKIKYKSGRESIKIQFKKSNRKRLFSKIGTKERLVSGLVADAFGLERKEGYVIYHRDGNVQNNRIENLAVETRSQVGKITGGSGRAIPVIKLDPETLEELDYYESAAEAGRENYVNKDVVSACVNGRYNTCIGFKWIKDYAYQG